MNELGEQQAGTTPEESGVAASDVRNHKFFKEVVGNLSEENKTLKTELQKIRTKIEEEAKAKDLKAKEEAGQYQQVLEQLKNENMSLAQKHNAELTQLKLENALARAGADEYFTTWAIHNFPGGDIADYVNSLKSDEKHSARFNLGQIDTSQPVPLGAVPASYNPSNWQQTKQDLMSRDANVRNAADRKVRDYMAKHNKLPW